MSYDCLMPNGGIVQRQNSGLILRISARLARGLGSNPSAPIDNLRLWFYDCLVEFRGAWRNR